MSRTIKGAKPPGNDFGKRYRCDKHWASGDGVIPKDMADSERRSDSKALIKEELENIVEVDDALHERVDCPLYYRG